MLARSAGAPVHREDDQLGDVGDRCVAELAVDVDDGEAVAISVEQRADIGAVMTDRQVETGELHRQTELVNVRASDNFSLHGRLPAWH